MYADKTPEATSKEMTTEEAAQEEAAPSSAEAAEGKPVDEAAEGASGSDKPKKKRGWIKWVALAVVVFIIMFIPYWFTRDSSACGQCH